MFKKLSRFRLFIASLGLFISASTGGVMAFRAYENQTLQGVETSPGVWERQLRPDDSWGFYASMAAMIGFTATWTLWDAIKLHRNSGSK